MRVWIVLPAFNEAANLPELFSRFRELADEAYKVDLHILVIDDGSTDDTAAVARQAAGELPIDVIRNDVNRGLAATFMMGLTEAAHMARAADIVVCMDADNSHVPGQILRMVREIQEGRDVVIASRYRPGSVVKGVPITRRILSRGMSFLFRLVFPIDGVRDYSCGYRAYRASFLRKALEAGETQAFANDGFACMVGILLHLAREDAIIGEVPLVLRYDQKMGSSKMKIGRTIARTLAVLARERLGGR